MKHHLLCSLFFAVASANPAAASEDLVVLTTELTAGVPPGQQLERWLKSEFYQRVERRSAAFETMLKSEAACRQWQEERRAFFLERIGNLPERSPLNARVVGTLQGKGYRVERILLESRPGFHVTGNLYLPESPPPWPAVLVACGHSHDGKAAGQYQRASILLARNGLAALCYDPVGQGERYQVLDLERQRDRFEEAPRVPTPHPNVRFLCTTEHTLMGLGCALIGSNIAQHRIWDGMRVIDYLQSRPDIRADRIGCCGNSGGGTETAYLMALDDRIAAAAPGCYLTTFRRLIDTRGPQDGEQNIFGQIEFGMDEADYCIVRAPRPTLICAGTRDATFDFRGTWELFLDAKRFYSRLGHAAAMEINAPDAPHGFTIQQREATARWMSRWLLGRDVAIRERPSLPDTIADEQLRKLNQPDWTAAELQCTPHGQVLLMPGERSVFQINSTQAEAWRAGRAERWRSLDDHARRQLVRDTVGARAMEFLPQPVIETVGLLEREQCTVHKLVVTVGPGLRLPALGFVPRQPSGRATLYLHGTSMKHEAQPGGLVDSLVRQGTVVLAAELRGIGETETGHGKNVFGQGRFGPDNLEILTAYLLGKSFVGMRTEDVLLWARFLKSWSPQGLRITDVHLAAQGEAAIPALHAAALESHLFRAVSLTQMIPTWESVVSAAVSFNQSVNVVHGALRCYDLPDLARLAGAEKVSISEPLDAAGQPLP